MSCFFSIYQPSLSIWIKPPDPDKLTYLYHNHLHRSEVRSDCLCCLPGNHRMREWNTHKEVANIVHCHLELASWTWEVVLMKIWRRTLIFYKLVFCSPLFTLFCACSSDIDNEAIRGMLTTYYHRNFRQN